MSKPTLNRIKAALAESGKTNKDLAEYLKRTESTVSRWCTNDIQPSVDVFYQIAKYLGIDIRDLFVSTKQTS